KGGFWSKLRQDLISHKLLPAQTSLTPGQIASDLQKVINSKEDLRILLLLDESDQFLAFDAADNFAIIKELRDLKVQTRGRFKVVLAGNLNVSRFQHITNQPLAQFGDPVVVGPLKPPVARELVTLPFEALGFRFKNDASVLRILSYTNYHAGLIQVFCQKLLERMYEAPP